MSSIQPQRIPRPIFAVPSRSEVRYREELLSLSECAELTGLARRTVSLYVGLNKIPSVKISSARVFDRAAIRYWMIQRAQQGVPGCQSAEYVDPDPLERGRKTWRCYSEMSGDGFCPQCREARASVARELRLKRVETASSKSSVTKSGRETAH